MAKKVNDKNIKNMDLMNDEFSKEDIEKARKETRADFNKRLGKWITVEEDDADDEYFQQTKKEFDEEVKKVQELTYLIATHDDGLALKAAEFLKNWNAKFSYWSESGWRGIIKFDNIINDYIKDLKENKDKDFTVDYNTLIYLYQAMKTPYGIGLESAKNMAVLENYDIENDKPFEENVPVTYSGILESVMHHVNMLTLYDKKLAIYQERVRMAAAGLKMTLKISELEEFKEFHDAWTCADIPEDPNEIKKMAE